MMSEKITAQQELCEALLFIARTMEWHVFVFRDKTMRRALHKVHDMQREARDGTLILKERE